MENEYWLNYLESEEDITEDEDDNIDMYESDYELLELIEII